MVRVFSTRTSSHMPMEVSSLSAVGACSPSRRMTFVSTLDTTSSAACVVGVEAGLYVISAKSPRRRIRRHSTVWLCSREPTADVHETGSQRVALLFEQHLGSAVRAVGGARRMTRTRHQGGLDRRHLAQPDELWALFQRVAPEAPFRPQGDGQRRHGDDAPAALGSWLTRKPERPSPWRHSGDELLMCGRSTPTSGGAWPDPAGRPSSPS